MGRFARKVRRARHAPSRAAVEVLVFLGLFVLLCTLLLWSAENAPAHRHGAGHRGDGRFLRILSLCPSA